LLGKNIFDIVDVLKVVMIIFIKIREFCKSGRNQYVKIVAAEGFAGSMQESIQSALFQ